MPTYVVQHRYRSDFGGPWQAGQELEMTEEEAARLNNDSPGVLKEKTARATTQPTNDRQAKSAPKNRAAAKK